MSFTSLGLSAPLLHLLDKLEFAHATPIQEQAIPAILAQKDVLGIAHTGSGKTVSYVLPVVMNLQGKQAKSRHVNALVLVPTRELAAQVTEVFKEFGSVMPERIKSLAVYGGVSINPQMMQLQGVHVLVATPGRLLELVEKNAVQLSEIEVLVLDEADKMLNLGFKDEVDEVLALLPKVRQNLLFSATLNDDVNTINQKILHLPVVINIDTQTEQAATLITQTAYAVTADKKGPLLRYLIKHHEMKQVLVFTSSVYQADNVADKLRKNGIEAVSIHSKKSQGARTDSLRQFKQGAIQVLVATDLLARGIDIQFLPYVVNYELPRSPKDYIHRIGRTGRAESSGEAISLVSPEEEHHFGVIQKKMKKVVLLQSSMDLKF